MNNLAPYLDWATLWDKYVRHQIFEEDYHSSDEWELMKKFQKDNRVDLDFSECEIQDDEIIFQWSETGGQNESDTQGWYRLYWFRCKPEEDFIITDSGYGIDLQLK